MVKKLLTAKIPAESKEALGWSRSQEMFYCPLRELTSLLFCLQCNPIIRVRKQIPIFPFCQILKPFWHFWKLAEYSQPIIYLTAIKHLHITRLPFPVQGTRRVPVSPNILKSPWATLVLSTHCLELSSAFLGRKQKLVPVHFFGEGKRTGKTNCQKLLQDLT